MTALAQCLLDFGDSEFTIDSPESSARARSLYLTARDVLRSPELAKPAGAAGLFASNPALNLVRRRADNQLTKLRQGRNIAGMLRVVEPPAPTSLAGALPATDASGAPRLRPPQRLRPTPYRFSVLLERSRSLVHVAEQVEVAYLQALEKVDAENYGQLRAGHDLNLARAGEQLQRLRASEAQDNTELSRRQKSRVEYQQNVYREWASEGLNSFERATLEAYKKAAVAEKWANGFSTAGAIAQGAISAAGAGSEPGRRQPHC